MAAAGETEMEMAALSAGGQSSSSPRHTAAGSTRDTVAELDTNADKDTAAADGETQSATKPKKEKAKKLKKKGSSSSARSSRGKPDSEKDDSFHTKALKGVQTPSLPPYAPDEGEVEMTEKGNDLS